MTEKASDPLTKIAELISEIDGYADDLSEGEEMIRHYNPGALQGDATNNLYRALLALSDADKAKFLATLPPLDGSRICGECSSRCVDELADLRTTDEFVPCPGSIHKDKCARFRAKGEGWWFDWEREEHDAECKRRRDEKARKAQGE